MIWEALLYFDYEMRKLLNFTPQYVQHVIHDSSTLLNDTMMSHTHTHSVDSWWDKTSGSRNTHHKVSECDVNILSCKLTGKL